MLKLLELMSMLSIEHMLKLLMKNLILFIIIENKPVSMKTYL